jgi:hypothetical protein
MIREQVAMKRMLSGFDQCWPSPNPLLLLTYLQVREVKEQKGGDILPQRREPR